MKRRHVKRENLGRRRGMHLLLAVGSFCALLAGCQTLAHVNSDDECCRSFTLAHQVLRDTIQETATRPLHTGAHIVGGVFFGIGQTGRELVAKRLLVPVCGGPPPLVEERCSLDEDRLEALMHGITRRPLQPAHVQFFLDGEKALRRLESMIDTARCSLDVLMYQWDSDALGWGLAQRLAERAAALGVPGGGPVVRVLVDGGGNLFHGPPEGTSAREVNEALGWLAKQPYVMVLRTRNPLATFDHRKLVVADGTVAWTGGRNFTLASFFEYRDLSYTLEGPLVHDMAEAFEDTWEHSGGKPRPAATDEPACDQANVWARVIGTGTKRRDLSKTLYKAVDQSLHHVWLENPYFTDNLLWCKLAAARRRGADVRVIFAKSSQSRMIDRAMRVTANRLLQAGVRVWMHPGTTHVKAASIDSRWAYLGTGNFDNLSMRRNHEIGIAIAGGPLVAELEESLFVPDCRPEWEITTPFDVGIKDYVCEMLANLVL